MALRIVSNMSRPLSGSSRKGGRDGTRSERTPPGWSETGSFRALGFHFGGLRAFRLLGEDVEHGTASHEQVIEIEVRKRDERAGQHEGIEGELGHVRITRNVAVFRMIAPAPPQSSQADKGAHEGSYVEPKPQETMLTEDFEVHAMCIEGFVKARAVVNGPNVLVPQRSEPRSREWAAHRDVPSRLERLQTPHRGHVSGLHGLLLLDRAEAVPEALGCQWSGYDPYHEHGGGEPHPPRRAPHDDEEHEGQPQVGAAGEREDDREDGAREGDLEDALEPGPLLVAREVEEDRKDHAEGGPDVVGVREEAHVGTEDPVALGRCFCIP